MKIPFSRTRASRTGNPPTDSLLSVLRTLGLGSLRVKIAAFTFLSLIGGLSQAVLLVLISEVAVAEVQGKHSIHALGRSLSPTNAIVVAVVALALFFSTSIVATLLSTSASEQALTGTRARIVNGFFRSNWSLQSTERLGHLQQLLTMNSTATANAVSNLSTGLQSLLMVAGLLAVALAVDPPAAIGVIGVGIVLSQILRPLNIGSRRAYRELSKVTRAMATRVTEYTRLSRDFRLFGVETRVMDKLRGLIRDAGHVYRRAQILINIAPVLYQSFALGFVIVAIVFLTHAGHARFAELGAILLLVLRSVSYGSSVQSSIQGLRASQGMLEDVTRDLRRFADARISPGARVPQSFGVDFDAVEYSYDGVTLALSGITMHIPEGKIVGVLGPSGSGKTTISQLLLGLREPTSGRATIGGEDAAAISKSDAHSTVALVPQEPVLLQGSVIDNIRFFRDFDEREIVEAVEIGIPARGRGQDGRRLRDPRGRGGWRPVGRAEAAPCHRPGPGRLPEAHRPGRAHERRRRTHREAHPSDPVRAQRARHRDDHLASHRDDGAVRSAPGPGQRQDRRLRRARRGPGRIGIPEHRVEPTRAWRGPHVAGLEAGEYGCLHPVSMARARVGLFASAGLLRTPQQISATTRSSTTPNLSPPRAIEGFEFPRRR